MENIKLQKPGFIAFYGIQPSNAADLSYNYAAGHVADVLLQVRLVS